MEAGLREVCRSVRIGKILIQRVSLPLSYVTGTLCIHEKGRGNGKGQTVLLQGLRHRKCLASRL